MASVEKDTSLNLKIQPSSFLKKRIKELAGLIVLALMALLSAAFFTYNAGQDSHHKYYAKRAAAIDDGQLSLNHDFAGKLSL